MQTRLAGWQPAPDDSPGLHVPKPRELDPGCQGVETHSGDTSGGWGQETGNGFRKPTQSRQLRLLAGSVLQTCLTADCAE